MRGPLDGVEGKIQWFGHPSNLPVAYAFAVDWSLRACGRKGHVTYAPAEAELQDRLHVATPAGDAWRCLRCGDFVVGEPRGSGPAEQAPIVLRGRALRDAFVLRLLAAERMVRGLVIGLAAFAVLRYAHSENSLRLLFEKDTEDERSERAELVRNASHFLSGSEVSRSMAYTVPHSPSARDTPDRGLKPATPSRGVRPTPVPLRSPSGAHAEGIGDARDD